MKNITLTGNPDLVTSCLESPPQNPLLLLEKWLDAADVLKILEPRGFTLSTIDHLGKPSSRVVLLRDINENGIIFSTSSNSHKGQDLAKNPVAAGTLWWRETVQQINFIGSVTTLSDDISNDIWNHRTREAKAIALLSSQSSIMADEADLTKEMSNLVQSSEIILRPKHWHAYHIRIESIEFWYGNISRLHQRLRYVLKNDIFGSIINYNHKRQKNE